TSILVKAVQAAKYFYILYKENPDIIFTSSANSTVAIAAFYSKIFHKTHIHRTANIMDTNKGWIKQNGFLGKMYKYGLENASFVVCQTHEQKEKLLENHNINAILFRNIFDFSQE